MSTISRTSSGSGSATATTTKCRAAAGLAPVVVIRWAISPSEVQRVPLVAASLNGMTGKVRSAELCWTIDTRRGEARASLNLHSPRHATVQIAMSELPVPVQTEHTAFGTSLDAGAELALTLQGERLVYARTDLLERVLKLAGGVYEVPAAEFLREATPQGDSGDIV